MSRNDDGRWDDIINMDFPKLTSRSPKFMSGNVTIGEYEKSVAIELAGFMQGRGLLERVGLTLKRAYYHCLPESYFARKVGFES
ncbi:hypothetical protein HN935_03950 [archaeon]|jgi:hypothetical protein|nr:hypothetical protein [archaeon]